MDGWLFTDFQGHDFITKEFLHKKAVLFDSGAGRTGEGALSD